MHHVRAEANRVEGPPSRAPGPPMDFYEAIEVK